MSGKEVLLLLFLYRLIVSLHVGNLLLQLAHLLFLQYLLYSIGTTWMNWSTSVSSRRA